MMACQGGKPFQKDFYVEMLSPNDSVDVQIGTKWGQFHVSKCPYALKEVIKDQGICCIFADASRSTAALKARRSPGATLVAMEMQKVIDMF